MKFKKQITFIFNDKIGGVATMNFGIISQANLCEEFNVNVILISDDKYSSSRLNHSNYDSRINLVQFVYSKYDNNFYVTRNLRKILNNFEGILITNDGLELFCLGIKNNSHIVFHIVHDLYNLKLSLNYSSLIDYFICHTIECHKLIKSNPALSKRSFYLPFGVDIPNSKKNNENNILKIVSLSRLVESKGILNLINIEKELILLDIKVDWLILGDGPLKNELEEQWRDKNNVSFLQPSNTELTEILSSADVFISLSEFEGYGISLLEAMSFGLIPIVTRLPIGIHSIITNEVGLVIEKLDFYMIAKFINKIDSDRKILFTFRESVKKFVINKFSSSDTGHAYLHVFKNHSIKKTNGNRIYEISNFGLFDKPWIPNLVCRILKYMKYAVY